MSSADWMVRNLDKRLEVLFPVQQPELTKRLIAILNTFFADNVKARRLLPDGTYEPVPREGTPVRAQEQFLPRGRRGRQGRGPVGAGVQAAGARRRSSGWFAIIPPKC